MNAQVTVRSLLFRLRASRARLFAPAIASPALDTVAGPPPGQAGTTLPPAAGAPLQSSPAQAWQAGFDAFRHGETAPDDPDAAEGWYWAENTASRRHPLD